MVDWTEVIVAGVGILFTAIIIPLVKAAFDWLKSKTQNEAIRAAIDEAQKVADQVVAGLQQSVVEKMKSKSADGKLSAEDISTIGELALEQFLNDVSSKTHDVLMNNTTDIETYIKNLIESRVKLNKNWGL